MRQIAIDIETFSPAPLAKTGVYPYAEHPDFRLLIFGYSIDGGPVEVVDLASGGGPVSYTHLTLPTILLA